MSDPYIGEIRMFGGSFAPAGWAFCQGQDVAISQNDALFMLLGTTYGGDGQSTFGIPDLQGRIPIHAGTLNGTPYTLGEKSGTETVTLTTQQMPIHNHAFIASQNVAGDTEPTNKMVGQSALVQLYIEDVPTAALSPLTLLPVGGSQPHGNMMPYLCVSFIISLYGIYPPQN
ncbi:MAG TPA: tail fiber protein [Pyrinomonadaceae bacterium]|jgi:microcystin-dependent protein